MQKSRRLNSYSRLPAAPRLESPATLAKLEGVGAEAAEGQVGAAGGAVGLSHRHLVVDAAGPHGREWHHARYPGPQPRPLGVPGSADLV